MNSPSKLCLSFAPAYGNVDMVRAAVGGICSNFFHLPCHAASVMDFCLIVTELMNNAVEHAGTKRLDAELILTAEEATFRLISEGEGFDPTQQTASMPDVEQADLPEGGYGLALIQALADGMEYECRDNRNTVTLRKTFPKNTEKE